MENTTNKSDAKEVLTELTLSDIKTLDYIIDTCINITLFADESNTIIDTLSKKLKSLIVTLESPE